MQRTTFQRAPLMCVIVALALTRYTAAVAQPPPAWWASRNVVIEGAMPHDYAVANLGQLKWFSTNAFLEMEAVLPGGAGPAVWNSVASFTNAGPNYALLNVGQLKATATPFYERLAAAGCSSPRPWTEIQNDDVDSGVANLGQLKNVFTFAILNLLDETDRDNDTLADSWELYYFGSLAQTLTQDADNDGLNNRAEYLARTNPTRADTDGDGLSDRMEVQFYGRVFCWGGHSYGQTNIPSNVSNVVKIAAGDYHSVALKQDGTVVSWGYNTSGQTNVPANLTNVVSIAAGGFQSMALTEDGTVVRWGSYTSGQTLTGAVAIAAGTDHGMALTADGTVIAWGNNTYGQCTVPTIATNVIAIAAGAYHSLALRGDGHVVAWGQDTWSQCFVPATATPGVAIAAGDMHNLVIRADGAVIAWGADNRRFQDGHLVGTYNLYGQCTVPAAATNAMAVAVGAYHSLALRRDGKVLAWGLNDVGQCSGATNVSYASALASGSAHGIALSRLNPLKSDTDNDGLPDGWECTYGLDPLNERDAALDADGDGLSNRMEFTHATHPRASDTDTDGIMDGWELTYGLDPLNQGDAARDNDGDGVTNLQEYRDGSDPRAGYFMKETFERGIPSDWSQSAWPHVRLNWGVVRNWESFLLPSGFTCPTPVSGQTIYTTRYLPGTQRITTPVLNLGCDMSNVLLKFLYWKAPHVITSNDKLIIYGISRKTEADNTFTDQETQLLTIHLTGAGSSAWSPVTLRLPEGSATRQLVFEYVNTYNYSFDTRLGYGICLAEISLSGDYGRVAYQPMPPLFANSPVLPAASQEIPYSCPFAVHGGVPPFQWRYHWSVVAGALPEGLALDPNTGNLQGIPRVPGQCLFSIEVKNNEGMATTNQFRLNVLESVTALSETFDRRWLPTGWNADGWGPQVDVKALNGSNTNAWGRGSPTTYATLTTSVLDFGGLPEKAVLRFRYRNPFYTTLLYRDSLVISFQDASGTRIIAATQDLTRFPDPTWPILPDTQDWKAFAITLPEGISTGKLLFQAYARVTLQYAGSGIFLDDIQVFAGYADPLFLAWLDQYFPDGIGSGFEDDPDSDGLVNIDEYLNNADPCDSDSDDDDLKDGDEVLRGTSPISNDTDGDGLEDGWEVCYNYSPLTKNDASADPDHDGLADREECLARTDPTQADTDDDGLLDGQEYVGGTHPLFWDTDGDGCSDYEEMISGTEPTNAQSITAIIAGTISYPGRQIGPLYIRAISVSPDVTRMAVIASPGEYLLLNTKTLFSYSMLAFCDTNGNGIQDVWEPYGVYSDNPLLLKGNTNNINITLADPDSDHDTLPDGWEIEYFATLAQTAGADFDNDGVSNGHEYVAGTSPTESNSVPRVISGTVAYTGLQTGAIVISANTQPGIWSSRAVTIVDGPSTFSIAQVPTLVEYWVEAYRDSNGNGSNDAWEATGSIAQPIHLTADCTGLVITLSDPDTDGDGLPDWQEMLLVQAEDHDNITSIFDVGPADDFDGDGISNGTELSSGTSPSDNTSLPPVIGFVSQGTTVIEADTLVTIPLQVSPPASDTSIIRVYVARSTATAGVDYEFVEADITLSPGQTTHSLSVAINSQALAEPDKTVVFGVSCLSGKAVVGKQSRFMLTIKDDTDGTGAEPAPGWVVDTEDTLRFRVLTPLAAQ